MRHRQSLLTLSLSFVLACSSARHEESLGKSAAPIVGGTPSGADQNAVVAVIAVGGLCTGTLVAPNLVVTARHCVSKINAAAAFGCKSDGTVVSADPQAGKLGADVPVERLTIFTGPAEPSVAMRAVRVDARVKAIVHDGAATLCGHDIAFLVLDRELSLPVAKLRKAPPASGETLTVVGYGIDATGSFPATRLQRATTVLRVGPLDTATGAGLTADALLMSEGNCDGDSGGPGFASDGTLVSLDSEGASSGKGNSGCEGSQEIATIVSAHPQLIAMAFATAGQPLPFADQDDAGPLLPDAAAGDSNVTPTPVATPVSSCSQTPTRRVADAPLAAATALAIVVVARAGRRRRGYGTG